jgi:predicted RNA-binding Zn ribbon-like protein
MKPKYETLDDYLDDLDAIKARVAEKTRDMTTAQVKAYFAGSARRLRELTGQKLRVRRAGRKVSTAKK